MFTFYIENYEPFGSLIKNCPKLDKTISKVSRFSELVVYKSSVSIVQKAIIQVVSFTSVNVCICTSIS